MFEHRCGALYCPECMDTRAFIALNVAGRLVNLSGQPVAHIADASCRECSYTYGSKDERDPNTGAWRRGLPGISDAQALAAARALGLPPSAALFARTEAALAAELAAADAAARSRPGPAADAPMPGPTAPATDAAVATPGPVSGSLRSPAPGPAPAASVPSFAGPPAAGGPRGDDLTAFLEQFSRG